MAKASWYNGEVIKICDMNLRAKEVGHMGSSAIDAIRQAEKNADEVLSNASNEA